ncbi:Uncharacterised protein [Raoultella terrigena]|uniref:Uncharacterized protein n=1 Tax=Raoultella terrigena TaxID=577 RepID=A0A3P8IX11_RAOTE|nr:Uncharacterised protein [Raoultella terrigena]
MPMRRVTKNHINPAGKSISTAYSSRLHGLINPIKSQGPGLCHIGYGDDFDMDFIMPGFAGRD